jgi:hypothetical protein
LYPDWYDDESNLRVFPGILEEIEFFQICDGGGQWIRGANREWDGLDLSKCESIAKRVGATDEQFMSLPIYASIVANERNKKLAELLSRTNK